MTFNLHKMAIIPWILQNKLKFGVEVAESHSFIQSFILKAHQKLWLIMQDILILHQMV